MNIIIPDSSSIILRSTHILLVRIEQARFGEWVSVSNSLMSRTLLLDLRLEQIFKGTVVEAPGDVVSLTATQYASKTTRVAAIPGVWSEQPLEEGVQFIAFCRSSSDRASELLQDPVCERVVLANTILDDVQLAVDAETQELSVAQILEQAFANASTLDLIFVEYLWARHSTTLLGNSELYSRLMQFLLSPELPYIARATLLDAVYSKLIALPNLASDRVNQLVNTLIQLLTVNRAESLYDTLIDIFLPNLVGLTSGSDQKRASVVLQNASNNRQILLNFLRTYQGPASTEKLLDWLQSS